MLIAHRAPASGGGGAGGAGQGAVVAPPPEHCEVTGVITLEDVLEELIRVSAAQPTCRPNSLKVSPGYC